MNSDSEQPRHSSISEMLEAAAAKRVELSNRWPTAAQVGPHATEQRKSGQLLGVYLTEPHHHFRYPVWQFQPDGQPVAHFAEILSIIREDGPYLDKEGRTTGWGEVEWFLSGHVLLNGECPADVLQHDPKAVLEAARVEYIEEGNLGGF